MIKKLAVVLLLGIVAGSKAKEQENDSKSYTVSETCYNDVEQIKQDVGYLYYYCKGAFQGMGKKESSSVKPSDVLRFLALSNQSKINENTKLTYMPASDYLRSLVFSKLDELDAAFIEKYNETEDIQETWEWFVEHFKQEGLEVPLEAYLQKLIKHDHKNLELKERGIYQEGRTLFIDSKVKKRTVEEFIDHNYKKKSKK